MLSHAFLKPWCSFVDFSVWAMGGGGGEVSIKFRLKNAFPCFFKTLVQFRGFFSLGSGGGGGGGGASIKFRLKNAFPCFVHLKKVG